MSARMMSTVAGRVLDATVSDARAAAPLRCIGCNGRECKTECQAECKNECEPFHGGVLSFQEVLLAPLRER
jgi:hypothetical protein